MRSISTMRSAKARSLIFALLLCVIILPSTALAGFKLPSKPSVKVKYFDEKMIVSGGSIKTTAGDAVLKIGANVLVAPTTVTLTKYAGTTWTPPAGKMMVSDLFTFNIAKAEAYSGAASLVITLKTAITTNQTKEIYYRANLTGAWRALSTTSHAANSAFADLTVTSGQVGIFVDLAENQSSGKASWYKYKNCDCAASRDYPKGAKLKVTCPSTGKSVTVTVNDYGPESWTNRVIDLDKTAFARLASPSKGIIDVVVEFVE